MHPEGSTPLAAMIWQGMAQNTELPSLRSFAVLLCIEAILAGGLWIIGLLSPSLLLIIGLLGLWSLFLWDKGRRLLLLLPGGLSVIAIGVVAYLKYEQDIWNDDNFRLQVVGTDIGLRPLRDDHNEIVGITPALTLYNPHEFDIHAVAKRRVTSFERSTSSLADSELRGVAIPGVNTNLPDDTIMLNRSIRRGQGGEGTIDYYVCYGKNPDELNKSWNVQGFFRIRYDHDGSAATSFHPTLLKEGECSE